MVKRSILLWGGFLLLAVALIAFWGGVWSEPLVAEPEPDMREAIDSVLDGDRETVRRVPNFPSAVDERISFKDFPYSGVDERSSYRQFDISLSSGKHQFLAATYLDEPDWVDDRNNDEALIYRLADLNAAFTGNLFIDLSSRENWSHIRLYIGDFAQDYCGDISVVLSFRNHRIFAMTELAPADTDLSASQCPLRPEDFAANKVRYSKREDSDEHAAFCAVRRECLKAYYDKAENQAKLIPKWLQEVADVELR